MAVRAEKKAATREMLLGVARDLFQRDGYEAVTVRQIATGADVSTGAIFSHFADKADLFEAATGEKAPSVEVFLSAVKSADTPFAEWAGRLHRQLYGAAG